MDYFSQIYFGIQLYMFRTGLLSCSSTVSLVLYTQKSGFISVFNQLDAQNLFHNKFYFMLLHVSSTCAHHQEVKIALHSLWYHHNYRCETNCETNFVHQVG